MATTDKQQSKDFSLGFCSFYCPQWCYVVFPPHASPVVNFTNESSGSTFPLLVIAIVGILTSAFLLVSYYTIVSKYCGTFGSPRGRPRPGPGPDVREAWRFCPSNGLDEAVFGNITVCRSERGDDLVEGTMIRLFLNSPAPPPPPGAENSHPVDDDEMVSVAMVIIHLRISQRREAQWSRLEMVIPNQQGHRSSWAVSIAGDLLGFSMNKVHVVCSAL